MKKRQDGSYGDGDKRERNGRKEERQLPRGDTADVWSTSIVARLRVCVCVFVHCQ
jgi:hypothetical protein